MGIKDTNSLTLSIRSRERARLRVAAHENDISEWEGYLQASGKVYSRMYGQGYLRMYEQGPLRMYERGYLRMYERGYLRMYERGYLGMYGYTKTGNRARHELSCSNMPGRPKQVFSVMTSCD